MFFGWKAWQAVEKRPSAAPALIQRPAAYFYVRLMPKDFSRLASGHF
jgi:hypothetical protein